MLRALILSENEDVSLCPWRSKAGVPLSTAYFGDEVETSDLSLLVTTSFSCMVDSEHFSCCSNFFFIYLRFWVFVRVVYSPPHSPTIGLLTTSLMSRTIFKEVIASADWVSLDGKPNPSFFRFCFDFFFFFSMLVFIQGRTGELGGKERSTPAWPPWTSVIFFFFFYRKLD